MLADDLDVPFIELSREIEKFAGCSVREIHDLYGTNAYRRYERRALEETVQIYSEVVIATPGGIVSDPATFNLLLAHCTTVWLQAAPEDHMGRVAAQGDTRPMAASKEAMDDLRRILSGRAAFYSKADLSVDTSGHDLAESFRRCCAPRCARPCSREAEPPPAAVKNCIPGLTRARTCSMMHVMAIDKCTIVPATEPQGDLDMAETAAHPARVDYRTDPSQYRHWKLSVEGPVATPVARHRRGRRHPPRLQAQAQQLRPGRRHRAARRAEPHPLRASRSPHGDRHQRARTASSARAPTSSCWACRATPGR